MENEKVVQILESHYSFFALTNLGNIYESAVSSQTLSDRWFKMKGPKFTTAEEDLADELKTE